MNKITTLFTGATGITTLSIAPQIIEQTSNASQLTQIVVQLIIGIITLVKLVRKKQ